MTLLRPALFALAALSITLAGTAQTYKDLLLVRDRPSVWADVLQVRAGLRGGFPESTDASVGLDDDLALDGHIYFRKDNLGDRRSQLQLYAGRDGAYGSLVDGRVVGGDTTSRLEVATRYYPFYREGFYRGDEFVPTGRYEGRDYMVRLGFAKTPEDGLIVEAQAFFKRYSFERNASTASSYVVPDNYTAIGGRFVVEHRTLQINRSTGRSEAGFILTLAVEREENDAERTFGTTGTWESELPSGLWRGEAHLEWIHPQSQNTFWEIEVDGRMTDRDDRVVNYDAQSPMGHFTLDGTVGLRVDSGAFSVTPYARGQFLRILEENGVGADQKTFFGGGVEVVLDMGETFSLIAEYSYLENESREPIGIDKDVYGEHMFFIGAVVRLGASR